MKALISRREGLLAERTYDPEEQTATVRQAGGVSPSNWAVPNPALK